MQGAPLTEEYGEGANSGGDKALNLVLPPLGKQKKTGGKSFQTDERASYDSYQIHGEG